MKKLTLAITILSLTSAAHAETIRRLLLAIDTTKSDAAQMGRISSGMAKSIVIDKFVGSCQLSSYMDTGFFEEDTKILEATWLLRIQTEGQADCSVENHWIDDRVKALTDMPGVKVESVLTDIQDPTPSPSPTPAVP